MLALDLHSCVSVNDWLIPNILFSRRLSSKGCVYCMWSLKQPAEAADMAAGRVNSCPVHVCMFSASCWQQKLLKGPVLGAPQLQTGLNQFAYRCLSSARGAAYTRCGPWRSPQAAADAASSCGGSSHAAAAQHWQRHWLLWCHLRSSCDHKQCWYASPQKNKSGSSC